MPKTKEDYFNEGRIHAQAGRPLHSTAPNESWQQRAFADGWKTEQASINAAKTNEAAERNDLVVPGITHPAVKSHLQHLRSEVLREGVTRRALRLVAKFHALRRRHHLPSVGQ
jgi:hypothetical protein